MPWRSGFGGYDGLALDLAAEDVDEVLVVGAGRLVGVARRRPPPLIVLQQRGRALRIVGRRLARLGLGVAARHDHHAVVVAAGGDRGLDRLELAPALERPVLRHQLLRRFFDSRCRGWLGRNRYPRLRARGDRALDDAQGVVLADDAHVARAGARDRPVASDRGVGTLPPAAGCHRRVGPRVRPVRRPLEVRARRRRGRSSRRSPRPEGPGVHAYDACSTPARANGSSCDALLDACRTRSDQRPSPANLTVGASPTCQLPARPVDRGSAAGPTRGTGAARPAAAGAGRATGHWVITPRFMSA